VVSVSRAVRTGLARGLGSFERQIAGHSKVATTPFIAPDQFPWAGALERNWQGIRAEMDTLMAHYDALPNVQDISAEQYELTKDDKWKSFFFVGFGNWSEPNCRQCPKTAALLGDIPGIITAFFSILAPNKHIPPHRGYYRGIVRYHLALKVPDDRSSCGIRVGGKTAHWIEGSGFFFDDTYQHEAWNRSDDTRVVLLLDVARPVSFPYSLLNRALIRAIANTRTVRTSKVNHEAWERAFEQVLNGQP
jgi:aspartyl/asparaginyl beta-hydroxylase (cupin superfamily)